MVYALTVAVAVLAVVIAILLGAQVELFRDMRQIRELTELFDRPFDVDIGPSAAGATPAAIGLTEWSERNPTGNGLLLVLSDRCATCRSLAAALDGAVPAHVQIVVSNPGGRPTELTEVWNLGAHVIDDTDSRILDALAIKLSPVAVVIERGVLGQATSVPSSRQLHDLIDRTRPQRPLAAMPGRTALS